PSRTTSVPLPSTPHLLSLFASPFTNPAPTQLYTLSLHDALPISTDYDAKWGIDFGEKGRRQVLGKIEKALESAPGAPFDSALKIDRKSTRLNSSHVEISYAVFCLKKKKEAEDERDSGQIGRADET